MIDIDIRSFGPPFFIHSDLIRSHEILGSSIKIDRKIDICKQHYDFLKESFGEENLIFPKQAIGVDTATNIQSGIMYGAVQQIEGFINKINFETDRNNNIILTGGFSKMLSPKLSFKHQLDIDLTLKGMILINESNY